MAMELLENTFNGTFWFADVAIGAGMCAAWNSEQTKKAVGNFLLTIESQFVLGGKQVPQHIQRTINTKSATYAYWLIKYVLIFGAVWNVLTNIFATKPRFGPLNVLYLYYPLLTAFVSAHDILLDDDKSVWATDVKKRHVLFPMNIEGNKILASDLSETNVANQLLAPKKALQEDSFWFATYAFTALTLYKILPPVCFFLVCPFILPAHNRFNMVLDDLFEIYTLKAYKNKYEHFFGNMFAVAWKGDEHDYKGKQYQYFLYSFKPIEKMLNKMVFEKVKKQSKSSTAMAEAKVAYYLARGVLITGLLFTLNLINTSYLVGSDANKIVGLVAGMAPYAAYYGIHAAISYLNGAKGYSVWFDETWKRLIPCAGEMLLSGYLFYNPMMQMLR